MTQVDWDLAAKQFEEILKEREEQTGEPIHFTPQDLVQLFDRIQRPEKSFGVITKDMKTSNLDKITVQKVNALKSIAKDFIVFRDSFDLEKDRWIDAVLTSIDGDAEIICAASQGLAAKLLDTFVTLRRENKVISRLDKEKKGDIFK